MSRSLKSFAHLLRVLVTGYRPTSNWLPEHLRFSLQKHLKIYCRNRSQVQLEWLFPPYRDLPYEASAPAWQPTLQIPHLQEKDWMELHTSAFYRFHLCKWMCNMWNPRIISTGWFLSWTTDIKFFNKTGIIWGRKYLFQFFIYILYDDNVLTLGTYLNILYLNGGVLYGNN